MPLMVIDVLAGRSEQQLKELRDAVHEAMVEAFAVPVRDRYQVVQEHDPSHLVVEDTGLGISRSPDLVLVRVISRPRTREQKEAFYRTLCDGLRRRCGVDARDVVVSITKNTDGDWSFRLGRAQFLTGEL